MVMERGQEGLRRLGHADLAQSVAEVQAEFARRSGMTDIPLTGELPGLQAARSEITLPSRPSFEIPTVSEALYNKTREALVKEGFTHVVAIEPISTGQLATDEATRNCFGFVNSSENMRSIIPLQMEVAIDPKNVKIKKSNSKSTDAQIEMTRDEEAKLKGKLPEDVRDLVSMPMHDPSTLSQADFDYQNKTGKPLYPDFFVRTDTETVSGSVADVGRDDPSRRLDVNGWARGLGADDVIAARVVVLPRKLTEPV